MLITPTTVLDCVATTVSEKIIGMDGQAVPALVSFILNVQSTFQPHLALTAGNVKEFWDTYVKPHEVLIDFLYTTLSQVRYRTQLTDTQWIAHTALLAETVHFEKGDAIHAALKDRLTDRELAGQLLRKEPWIVVVVWLSMCPWIIDTATRRKLTSVGA